MRFGKVKALGEPATYELELAIHYQFDQAQNQDTAGTSAIAAADERDHRIGGTPYPVGAIRLPFRC